MHNDLKREVADREGWDYNPVSRTAVFRILTLSAHVYWDGKGWSAYITGPAIRELSPDVSDAVSASDALNAVIRCLEAHLSGEAARTAHDRALDTMSEFLIKEFGAVKARELIERFSAENGRQLLAQLGR